MSEKLERITYRIENNFFLTVIRHGLTLIIPVILAGGVACAFMNLPFVDYSKAIGGFDLMLLHSFLEMIYQGTFGVFSMPLSPCSRYYIKFALGVSDDFSVVCDEEVGRGVVDELAGAFDGRGIDEEVGVGWLAINSHEIFQHCQVGTA